ncbi:MAG: PilZ domain-containing protein [Candidatus Omnitrophica bacterium]|nr:PilZ domain-containing protein [Candidatus Omnitrophota bacterium]
MEIKLEEVKNVFLYIDNSIIEGKIVEIDPSVKKVVFEFKPGSPLITADMGKRGEVFFEYKGNRYFVAGKTFFQPPSRAMITVETNIEIERRKDVRAETPALPATVSYKSGIFKKKHIVKSTILNISMKGAKIETSEQLEREISYDIETSFPYHHSKLDFIASFIIKNTGRYRNLFIYGIQFVEMDMISENNLKRYLFGPK